MGKNCVQQKWGKKDFLTYMKDNMYQKMDPINKSDDSPASSSVKRAAKLTSAYTIVNSADAYSPDKNP